MSDTIKDREEKIVDSFSSIIEGVNCIGLNDKELASKIVDKLTHSHRTLQQSFWKIINLMAKDYANRCDRYCSIDLRNEAAAEFTRKIRDMDIHMPLI